MQKIQYSIITGPVFVPVLKKYASSIAEFGIVCIRCTRIIESFGIAIVWAEGIYHLAFFSGTLCV